MKPVLVIVNPAARGGRGAAGWAGVQTALQGAGIDFEAALTSGPHEAIRLSRDAVRANRPLVVAAGGDGTVNEVVNGFFEAGRPLPTETRLGVIPLGTGGDFRRSFRIPGEPEAAVRILADGVAKRIDAGRVAFRAHGGHQAERYFINIADAGLGGEVMVRVNRSSKRLGATATFTLATVVSAVRYKSKWMRVVIDGKVHELLAQQVVVANGQYFGSGMQIAPFALPDDGLFDVLVVPDVSLLESAMGLSRVRRGRHLDRHPERYLYVRAHKVTVESPELVLVDVDGEQPGYAPAEFEVIPKALTLMTPA